MSPPNVIIPRPILPKLEPNSSSASPSLDALPDGETAPKRRCISSACMPCRKRKSKCDGEKPSCNACTSVYDTKCEYDIDSDHRRKGALKRDIKSLTDQKGTLNSILDAIRNGSDSDVDDIIQMMRSSPDESYESISQSIQKMSLTPKKTEPATLEGELAEFAGKSSLDKSGETRHYGHTSNLSFTVSDDEPPVIAVEQTGTWTTVTDDVHLVKHLFDLYFTWSHPFYVLFSEEVFYHGLNGKKLKYCTPLLVNAILAVGCNYSDRPEARADPNNPSTVGDHFFAEAKRLLEADDRSCLTTVAALGLMAIRQALNNHDSSSWKYAGRMMSMAIELGLHLSYNVQPNGKVTATEIEARRITFWGCYTLETIWSVCLGRISCLPRTAIKLEKPFLRSNLESKIWKPHGHPQFPHASARLEQASFTYNLSLQLSLLTEIVNDTVHMFYAPRDRMTSRKLLQHHARYKAWYKDLPECLAVKENSATLPQVLCLHIYYQNCLIHLFRPFLKVSFVQAAKPPRVVCTEAAVALSDLVSLYQQTYGLRRSYIIISHSAMTAAIQHLVDMSSPSPDVAARASLYLADSIRALYGMSHCLLLCVRYLKLLRNLIHNWAPNVPEHVKLALVEAELDSPGSNITPPHDEPVRPPSPPVFNDVNRKPSAPELIQIPDNSVTYGAPNQHLFWTPFPDHPEGIPLGPPTGDGANANSNIGALMDPGVGADWGQLNRDGFTVGQDVDGDAGLWSVNWDHGT